MRAKARLAACAVAALGPLGVGQPAAAQTTAAGDAVKAAVGEASAAFGLPPRWIEGVIEAESGGDTAAVSPAGAMGLMQLMPATWRELQATYGLGPDPFAVRDNVFAGAAYLREMLDRFGAPGFLAAYNAGPARYARTLVGRSKLPAETRRYVALTRAGLGIPSNAPKTRPPRGPGAELFPDLRRMDAAAPPLGAPLRRGPVASLFLILAPKTSG